MSRFRSSVIFNIDNIVQQYVELIVMKKFIFRKDARN